MGLKGFVSDGASMHLIRYPLSIWDSVLVEMNWSDGDNTTRNSSNVYWLSKQATTRQIDIHPLYGGIDSYASPKQWRTSKMHVKQQIFHRLVYHDQARCCAFTHQLILHHFSYLGTVWKKMCCVEKKMQFFSCLLIASISSREKADLS